MTPNKGIPPRTAPKNTAASRVLTEMAKGHAKDDAKRDMGSETPAPPTGTSGRGGTAGSFGHAAIPSRFTSSASAPAPKASGHVAKAVGSRPTGRTRTP